jgi:hypothetical protein
VDTVCKVRLYQPYEEALITPFQNPNDRHNYLINLPRVISKFKQGDICKVVKRGHPFYGKTIKVYYASADYIECEFGRYLFVLTQKDLKWVNRT